MSKARVVVRLNDDALTALLPPSIPLDSLPLHRSTDLQAAAVAYDGSRFNNEAAIDGGNPDADVTLYTQERYLANVICAMFGDGMAVYVVVPAAKMGYANEKDGALIPKQALLSWFTITKNQVDVMLRAKLLRQEAFRKATGRNKVVSTSVHLPATPPPSARASPNRTRQSDAGGRSHGSATSATASSSAKGCKTPAKKPAATVKARKSTGRGSAGKKKATLGKKARRSSSDKSSGKKAVAKRR